ncbi:hypothetical protein Bpfe_009605 [Biomphalaria pfeifferi]|uniref:Uncharacterized protein n=1 Tax=Biomphalaria pfeifferi TaxID=112525 RepID=A0AAD8BUG8_BIOPF|nr:hypothetical protein Bpfe_009605 [Biomphalaria pfeifferi]
MCGQACGQFFGSARLGLMLGGYKKKKNGLLDKGTLFPLCRTPGHNGAVLLAALTVNKREDNRRTITGQYLDSSRIV